MNSNNFLTSAALFGSSELSNGFAAANSGAVAIAAISFLKVTTTKVP
jgi:hypothetical protein